jgi:hypothetical protein
MNTIIIKTLGQKKFNILQFMIITALVFGHKVGLNSSGTMLIALKIAVLYLGVVAGMGLQLVFSEMKTKKEKVIHLSLVVSVIAFLLIIFNIKYF